MKKTVKHNGQNIKVDFDYIIGKEVDGGEEFIIILNDFNASYDCKTVSTKSDILPSYRGIAFSSQKKMIEHILKVNH